MGRTPSTLLGILVVVSLLSTARMTGYPSGITGVTNKGSGTGCASCHSGSSLSIVTISGPSSLKVGERGTYTLTINSGTLIGCDIAASGGTLAGVSSGLKVVGGELTHSAKMSGTSVTFTYTPTAVGSQMIYATGARTSRTGGWGHAPDYPVTVTDAQVTHAEETAAPRAFALHQNFPNPFNPSTVIRFDLAQGSAVVLTVYNLLGERVATLLDEHQSAGAHAVRFEGAGLASGAYLYRLEARPPDGAAPFIETRKFVLVR